MKKASGVVVYSMIIADGTDCQTVLLWKKTYLSLGASRPLKRDAVWP